VTSSLDNTQIPAGAKLGQHGQYEIVRLLGEGGMGAVYEARHATLKKRVAIKTMLPSMAAIPEAVTRFLREGEAASRIRHPHVVDVTDVGTQNGVPYLVMEFLEGEDLAAHIGRQGALAVAAAVDLMLPVCAAVAAGHAAGVIHRDLKPQNVFLCRRFRGDLSPMVLDFGVSKLVAAGDVNLTATSAIVGTASYMSPEQAVGAKQVDARSDQYALGAILYECLTGRRAHEGDNALAILRAIGDGVLTPPRRHRPDLPPALEAVVLRALAVSPAARFPSVSAFARALLPFASDKLRLTWTEELSQDGDPGATAAADPAAPHATAVMAPRPVAGGTRLLSDADAGASAPAASGGTTLSHGASEMDRPTVSDRAPPPRSRRALWAGAGAAALVAVAVVLGAARGGRPSALPAPPALPVTLAPPAPAPAAPVPAAPAPAPAATPPVATYVVDLRVSPSRAAIELDGAPAGTGSLHRALPADGRRHVLRATAHGFKDGELAFQDQPPPPTLRLAPAAAAHHAPAPGKAPAAVPDDSVLLERR
jgi:serine/threonine-protein kinase